MGTKISYLKEKPADKEYFYSKSIEDVLGKSYYTEPLNTLVARKLTLDSY